MNSFRDLPSVLTLERLGHSYEVRTYTYHEHGGTPDAAAQLGLNEHSIIKTLVFANGRAGEAEDAVPGVIALMHGDELVSVRKLERASGVGHLVPASFAETIDLTGLTPGGIGPFALRQPLPMLLQESVQALPELVVNAGVRGVVLIIKPAALVAIGAVYANLTR